MVYEMELYKTEVGTLSLVVLCPRSNFVVIFH